MDDCPKQSRVLPKSHCSCAQTLWLCVGWHAAPFVARKWCWLSVLLLARQKQSWLKSCQGPINHWGTVLLMPWVPPPLPLPPNLYQRCPSLCVSLGEEEYTHQWSPNSTDHHVNSNLCKEQCRLVGMMTANISAISVDHHPVHKTMYNTCTHNRSCKLIITRETQSWK